MITIPKLRKETNSIKIHNEDLPDNYAWIKQKNWQEVLKDPKKLNDEVANYLTEENAFVKEQLKENKQLETEIFQELKGRIKDKDSSVPLKDGAYYYFSEYVIASLTVIFPAPPNVKLKVPVIAAPDATSNVNVPLSELILVSAVKVIAPA